MLLRRRLTAPLAASLTLSVFLGFGILAGAGPAGASVAGGGGCKGTATSSTILTKILVPSGYGTCTKKCPTVADTDDAPSEDPKKKPCKTSQKGLVNIQDVPIGNGSLNGPKPEDPVTQEEEPPEEEEEEEPTPTEEEEPTPSQEEEEPTPTQEEEPTPTQVEDPTPLVTPDPSPLATETAFVADGVSGAITADNPTGYVGAGYLPRTGMSLASTLAVGLGFAAVGGATLAAAARWRRRLSA